MMLKVLGERIFLLKVKRKRIYIDWSSTSAYLTRAVIQETRACERTLKSHRSNSECYLA